MNNKGVWALVIAAIITISTAVAHMSCIFLGPSCYSAQMAPQVVIQSAIDGTLIAPITTVFISILFITCGVFALSGAGILKKLPLLKLALASIATLCLLRGISTLPLSLLYPDKVSMFSISAGIVWFITGGLFMYGWICTHHVRTNH
ncbi:hypothetical protein [Zooshikella sp. RANM57]|uniref:hypothetical protein n=1 Tax=Zooshikella sp. RANM57 TaxID=3425863 RepID=UPI003D6EC5C7